MGSPFYAFSGAGPQWPSKPILTAREAAELLGYASSNSLLRARKRGQLPFAMFQIPGRRGWFLSTEVAVYWVQSFTRANSGPVGPESAPRIPVEGGGVS